MADEKERRARLLALKDTVRAFFEVTNVAAKERGWSGAFRAVRQNDYMADSFLAELRALVDYIEVAFDPQFGKTRPPEAFADPTTAELPQSKTPAVTAVAPPRPVAGKPIAARPAAAPGKPRVAPPPPPPRRHQFADPSTKVDSQPGFGALEDPTGQMAMPPIHTPPPQKKKR